MSKHIITIFFLTIFLPAFSFPAAAAEKDKVPVDLYVMSLCPFGVQAENGLLPAVKMLESVVDFKLHYIAKASLDGKGAFQSLHGQPEVDEDMRQVCVRKHFPDQFHSYILERNKNYRDAHWQEAAKKTEVNVDEIQACVSGPEGAALLTEDLKAADARKAEGSPTTDINGAPYNGARGVRSFALAICDVLKSKGQALPDACKKAEAMPPDPAPQNRGGGKPCDQGTGDNAAPPAVFDIQVIVDSGCKVCGSSLTDAIKQNHPGANIKVVEGNSEEGKALIKTFLVHKLPFYILDKGVEKDTNAKDKIDSFYTRFNDKYIIKTGNDTYLPNVQLDRARVPNQLDIFVESLSPFTARADDELLRFLKESKVKDLTLSMHFIVQQGAGADKSKMPASSTGVRAASVTEAASVTTGALASNRGEPEIQEDIRQVCLFHCGN